MNRKINTRRICFWQSVLSPHMVTLAEEMKSLGYEVYYVINEYISSERKMLGWEVPSLEKITPKYCENLTEMVAYLDLLPQNTIHICQGFRGNGPIKELRKILEKRSLDYGVILESINTAGFLGLLRKLAYYKELRLSSYKFILASGKKTKPLLDSINIKKSKIHFPFAYFVPRTKIVEPKKLRINKEKPSILFVGKLIERKSVDSIFRAICQIPIANRPRLRLVGSGEKEQELRQLAKNIGLDDISWAGSMGISEIQNEMSQSDLLVLPSKFDGWGVVTNEALLAGIPVIVSEHCGSSELIVSPWVGEIFKTNDDKDFKIKIVNAINNNHYLKDRRNEIISYSSMIEPVSGAKYLDSILKNVYLDAPCPVRPWLEYEFPKIN